MLKKKAGFTIQSFTNTHLIQRSFAFCHRNNFQNANSPILRARGEKEAEVKMRQAGEQSRRGGERWGGRGMRAERKVRINGEQNSVWVQECIWQPPQLGDHSSKQLLWGLWLLKEEKPTGSKEAWARREGNSAYSKAPAQPLPLIALHYLILI